MKIKLIAALLLCASFALALVSPVSLADITGDGSVHQLASSGAAIWVQFVAASANSAAIRIGGSNVSSTIGVPVAAGGALFFPPVATDGNKYYSLSSIYYLAQSGDVLSVTYGQ